MQKKSVLFSLFLLVTLLLAACQGASEPAAEEDDDNILVTVSILPQAFFVEKIGGEHVTVNVMVGPGEEAHSYEPTPEQMKALNNSLAFFSIGIEYEENWIPRFQDVSPDLKIVDSAAGIERIPMEADHDHHHEETDGEHEEHEEDEAHHEEHAEDEARLDPHVWLSPQNGKIIAGNVLQTLIELAPEHEASFQINYDSLITEIDALDARIEETLTGFEQRTFMVFHPAWGYFAHDYDLEQVPVQVGGQDPSPSELAELVSTAQELDIKVIFVQPTFSSADAEAIAQEINGEVAVVNPLARDWLTNLETAAAAFAAALAQ